MSRWDPLNAMIALYEETERQQERTAALLDQLERSNQHYKAMSIAIPKEIGERMNAALARAASTAAEEIAANWTSANEHAERATKSYAKAISFDAFRLFGAAAAALLALMLFAWTRIPDGATIASLRIEEASLRARIAGYERLHAHAQPEYCADLRGQAHLCIAVDDSIRLQRKGYRAIRPN